MGDEKSQARAFCIAFADVAGNGVFQMRKSDARKDAAALGAYNSVCASRAVGEIRPRAKPRDADLEEGVRDLNSRKIKRIGRMLDRGKTVFLTLTPGEVSRFNAAIGRSGGGFKIALIVVVPTVSWEKLEGKVNLLNPELFSEGEQATIRDIVSRALGPGFSFVIPAATAPSGRGRRDFFLSFYPPNDPSEGALSEGGDPNRGQPEHYNAPEQLF